MITNISLAVQTEVCLDGGRKLTQWLVPLDEYIWAQISR